MYTYSVLYLVHLINISTNIPLGAMMIRVGNRHRTLNLHSICITPKNIALILYSIVLGQDSLFHISSDYPAAKWVPSINKAVLRACALYAASCSGMSLGRLKWFPRVQAR